MARPKLKSVAVLAAAVAVAALVFVIGEFAYRQDLAQAAEARTRNQLEALAHRFATEIAAGTDLGLGLAAVVAAEPAISERKFSSICHTILTAQPKVRNIALIVGTTVKYNCPYGAPPMAIDRNLRNSEEPWESFERLVRSEDAVVSGPLHLQSSGWLVVVRIPIRIKNDTGSLKYWGAISLPLRLDGLLSQAGIIDATKDLDLAIRGNRQSMRAPEVIFGNEQVFANDPIEVAIPLPEGQWYLAAPPTVMTANGEQTLQRLFMIIAAVFCGGIVLVAAPYVDRRRRLETEVNRNRDLLRALMRNSPIAMYVKDLQGRYLDLNEEAFRAYSMNGREFRGRTAKDFVKPELAAQLVQDDARALQGEVVRTERRSDDSSKYMWEREIKFPVIDASGKPIAIAGYVLDITNQKQAESRMLEALRRAESANREKSRFLATMSHELRTPLNAIIGFSDVLRREMFGPIGNETYQTYATDIHKSGQLLFDLLGGIIDLSAVEAGHLDIKSEALTPDQVIGDCRAILEALARERGHTLMLQVNASEACRGDRRLMRQVIINLTSNAAKYTRKGGKIEVSVEASGDEILFRVSDNGIGMADGDIERALQPFTRLGDPMRAEVGGSGIGLALVKRLVEAMNGTLTIDSTLEIGTTVEVRLPRAL